jgi:hypothetical protein
MNITTSTIQSCVEIAIAEKRADVIHDLCTVLQPQRFSEIFTPVIASGNIALLRQSVERESDFILRTSLGGLVVVAAKRLPEHCNPRCQDDMEKWFEALARQRK